MKAWNHLKTITRHRHLVMKACFNVGLYRQGLLHDLSKYTPVEFLVGCKYYQGTRSPNNAEREDKGYSAAWLHHKGRNKHHFEYWIDYGIQPNQGICGMKMPINYVLEMFIDRVCASKNYEGEAYSNDSALRYYMHGKGKYLLHPDSAILLEKLLHMLADEGEEVTFSYIRNEIVNKKYSY